MYRTCSAVLLALSLLPRLLSAAPDLSLQMSLDNPVPGPGQPVEFKVTLSNIGADAATDVVVKDKLPAELAVPTGLAAFPSTGSYDPATGTWTVGSLNAGSSATLVIPAIVALPEPPPCSVNIAETSHSLDTHRSNNRALAAVRRATSDRCIDLKIAANNAVYVDLSQAPVIAPNLSFTGANCSGTRCTIASLAAGALVLLEAVSGSFGNKTDRAVTLSFVASSSDTDYTTENNQYIARRALPPLQACPKFPDEGLGPSAGTACFIATAAFGSPLERHVTTLRDFRDRYLQRTAFGRAFIRFYYRNSPPIAAVIARHESLRFVVRMLLTPLALAIAFPLRGLAVLAMLASLVIGWPRRRARAPSPLLPWKNS